MQGEKEGGREEMEVMEGIRALTQPHRWSLLREALRKELDNHPYQVDRLSFLRGRGWGEPLTVMKPGEASVSGVWLRCMDIRPRTELGGS